MELELLDPTNHCTYFRTLKASQKFHDGKYQMQPESVQLMRAGKVPLVQEDKQWVVSTRRHHRTGARVLMAVFSERERRHVHYRDFFAYGTTDFLEPELQILELLDDYERAANVR